MLHNQQHPATTTIQYHKAQK